MLIPTITRGNVPGLRAERHSQGCAFPDDLYRALSQQTNQMQTREERLEPRFARTKPKSQHPAINAGHLPPKKDA